VRGTTTMVISEPNPYVLCPQCVQVNYLKRDSNSGLVSIQLQTGKMECCNCGRIWTYSREDVLPINRWRHGWYPPYFIYLLVNLKKDRIYVGRTERGLSERMWDYWLLCQNWKYWQRQAKRPNAYSMKIVRAMVETGFNAFDMILLEEGSSGGAWREKHWIFRLNALDPDIGYNHRAW